MQQLMSLSLLNEETNLNTLNQQLATGQNANDLTDYTPIQANEILNFQNAITQNQSYQSSIQNVQARLSVYNTTMGDMGSIASQAATLASQNQALNPATIDNLQSQAQSYLQQVNQDLNEQVNGRYIYSGLRYNTQPVTDLLSLGGAPTTSTVSNPALPTYDTEYQNGVTADANAYTADSVLVGTNFSINYGASSDDPSFQNLINGLRYISAATTAGQAGDAATYQQDMQTASTLLATAQTGIQGLNAGVANTTNLLTQKTTNLNTDITNLQNQLGNIQQANLSQVGTEINLLQTQLQASYSSTASLEQLSLVKYL